MLFISFPPCFSQFRLVASLLPRVILWSCAGSEPEKDSGSLAQQHDWYMFTLTPARVHCQCDFTYSRPTGFSSSTTLFSFLQGKRKYSLVTLIERSYLCGSIVAKFASDKTWCFRSISRNNEFYFGEKTIYISWGVTHADTVNTLRNSWSDFLQLQYLNRKIQKAVLSNDAS